MTAVDEHVDGCRNVLCGGCTELDDLRLRFNPHPVCPHCGHVDHDAWEHDFGSRDAIETDCDACEKPYRIVRHVEVTYSTSVPQ